MGSIIPLNIIVKIIEPGGTVTNFGEVTNAEFAYNPELVEYEAFTEAASKMFAGLIAQKLVTADEVADVIYNAATDGTDILRYAIGNADFMKRLNARAQMADQDYVNTIKNGFTKFLTETV